MRCPDCSSQLTRVIDSRDTGDAVRRRRSCQSCGTRFTTHERMEHRQLWVMKRRGGKEPFSRQKVLAGVALACRKRPFEADDLGRIVDRVVQRLEERRDPTVSAVEVGATVMAVLREVDDVAYIRFASVYGAFESVDQFLDVIVPLRATA